MPKLYMMEFTDTVTNKTFYKFGWTNHHDALSRFSDPVYDAFKKKCVASLTHPDVAVVKALELAFLCMFPKNIWLEEFLGDERTWDNFSGITEIVHLTDEEYQRAVRVFYNVKKRLSNHAK